MNITQFSTRAFVKAAWGLRPLSWMWAAASTAASVRLGYIVAASGKGQDETALAMGLTAFLLMIPAMMRADQRAFELAKMELENENLRIQILKPQPREYHELDPEYRSDAEVYIQEPDGSVSIYNEVRVSIKQLDRLYDMVQYGLKTNTRVLLTNDALTRPPHKVFTPGEFDEFIKQMRSEKLIIPKGKTQCLTERGERVIRQKWGLAHPQGKVSAIPLLPHWFGK